MTNPDPIAVFGESSSSFVDLGDTRTAAGVPACEQPTVGGHLLSLIHI